MNQLISHLQGLLAASLPGSDLLRSPQQEAVVGRLQWEEGPMTTQPSPALTSHPESAGTESELATNKPGRFKKGREGHTTHPPQPCKRKAEIPPGSTSPSAGWVFIAARNCGSSSKRSLKDD